MSTDELNIALSTSQPDAQAACHRAMLGYAQRKSNVVSELQTALGADPEHAFAHASLGLMLHGARNAAFKPKVQGCLSKAESFRASASPHEVTYIDALACVDRGDLTGMVKHLEHGLSIEPTDILALSLVQTELFWTGRIGESLGVSERVLPSWNASVPGYAEFLASRAFDLEEANRFSEAEAAGRESVELDPASVWATHAVAHVLLMQGRHQEGVDWISPQEKYWDECNQVKFHVWWHKCLFLLESGQHDAALDIYDEYIRNRDHELIIAMPDLYIDLQNGASLLWRLEHVGVDVGARWEEMAEVVVPRVADMSNPFTSAHHVMILAAAGNDDLAEQMIENMREFGRTETSHDLASRYTEAGVPAAQAALYHRQGKHAQVVETLMPARQKLWQMGGSHAQQDLFFQMLVDSAAKEGRRAEVASLLNEIETIGFIEPGKRVGYAAADALSSNA